MGKEEDIRIRKSWPADMDPSTKVHKTQKDYTRKHTKKAIEDALQEAEDDSEDLEWI